MTKTHLTTSIAVVAAIAVVALFFIFRNPLIMGTQQPALQPSVEGFVIQDEVVGSGALVQTGDHIQIQYTGRLENGTIFDSSVGSDPISFVLGAGEVILGWEQGIQGMKVGGKRLLIVPPGLGYGAKNYGPIPGNSTLIFEVELVKIEKPSPVEVR